MTLPPLVYCAEHGVLATACIALTHEHPPVGPVSTLLAATVPAGHDPVTRPSHYRAHPSGVECIAITKHMTFCLGNVVKYAWRAGLKSPNPVEDLKKARQYLDWEIERLEAEQATTERAADA